MERRYGGLTLIEKSFFSQIIEENKWKIPEPLNGIVFDIKQLDVVFVPLVVFDLLGHRIGYGNGFYDRFLAQCLPETLKI